MISFMRSRGLKMREVPKSITLTLPSMSSLSSTTFSGFRSLLWCEPRRKLPMDDVSGVAVDYRGQDLQHHLCRYPLRYALQGQDLVKQLSPAAVLGHQVEEALVLRELVQSHNVWVVLPILRKM